jgi:hypothetical protein
LHDDLADNLDIDRPGKPYRLGQSRLGQSRLGRTIAVRRAAPLDVDDERPCRTVFGVVRY